MTDEARARELLAEAMKTWRDTHGVAAEGLHRGLGSVVPTATALDAITAALRAPRADIVEGEG